MIQLQTFMRDSVVCPVCGLCQFVASENGQCRRCHGSLGLAYVEIVIPDSGFTDSRMTVYRVIGNTLHRLRAKSKLTQMMLAESVGVNRSSISRVEQGQGIPSLPVLLGSAAALGVDKVFLRLRDFHR